MALTTRHKLVKSLQTAFPRWTPFDHQQLAKLGVSSALAHHDLKSGWLTRLGRGVFMFPNDTLRQEGCLKFLARQMPGFHVGGKTALAWRGVLHNLPAREPLSLWGEGKAGLPEWFQKLFPSRYTTRNPLSPKLPKSFGLQPLPETPGGAEDHIKASRPSAPLLARANSTECFVSLRRPCSRFSQACAALLKAAAGESSIGFSHQSIRIFHFKICPPPKV